MIFQLEWCTFDGSMIHYFEAPEGTLQEFQVLCNKLMEEALLDAADGKPARSLMYKDDPAILIGYRYGVEEIVARLPDYGYKEVKFGTVSYSHCDIIDDRFPPEDSEDDFNYGKDLSSEVRQKVAEHNRKIVLKSKPC